VPDIEGDDAGRAAAKQHVGEPARRRSDIERAPSRRIDAERVERVRELDAAAPDIRMVGLDQLDDGVSRDRRARLRYHLAVHLDLARKDQRPRPLPRRRQLALDDGHIQASLVLGHGNHRARRQT